MEPFILWRAVLIFLTLRSVQCAETQPQSAVFLPEFALSPQGSFMEDATEDQFLTYRYDDQVLLQYLLPQKDLHLQLCMPLAQLHFKGDVRFHPVCVKWI